MISPSIYQVSRKTWALHNEWQYQSFLSSRIRRHKKHKSELGKYTTGAVHALWREFFHKNNIDERRITYIKQHSVRDYKGTTR